MWRNVKLIFGEKQMGLHTFPANDLPKAKKWLHNLIHDSRWKRERRNENSWNQLQLLKQFEIEKKEHPISLNSLVASKYMLWKIRTHWSPTIFVSLHFSFLALKMRVTQQAWKFFPFVARLPFCVGIVVVVFFLELSRINCSSSAANKWCRPIYRVSLLYIKKMYTYVCCCCRGCFLLFENRKCFDKNGNAIFYNGKINSGKKTYILHWWTLWVFQGNSFFLHGNGH